MHEPDPLIGKTLGQYKILGVLGRGGMGAVYRAEDIALARHVALKILPSELVQPNSERFQRFLREARSAGRLNHPNVVTIFQFGIHEGRYFIIMELVEGTTLVEILQRRGYIDPRRATNIIIQAARALGAAHAQGIIHRDVKPGNIMVTRTGMVKVADFGLAKLSGMSGEITQAGDVVGTPLYMAPEQCRGEPADPRSDLYSLCMSYYRLLTGILPFEAENTHGTMYKQINEPLPDPRHYVPNLPASVVQVLFKGLTKDPAYRFQNAAELERTLLSLDFEHHPEGGTLEELAGAVALAQSSSTRYPASQRIGVGHNSVSPTASNLVRIAGRSPITVAFVAMVFAAASFGITWLVVGKLMGPGTNPAPGPGVVTKDAGGNGGDPQPKPRDKEAEAREQFRGIKNMARPDTPLRELIKFYRERVINEYPDTEAAVDAADRVDQLEKELLRHDRAEQEYKRILAANYDPDQRIVALQRLIQDPVHADTPALKLARAKILELQTTRDRDPPREPELQESGPVEDAFWSVYFDGARLGNKLHGPVILESPDRTPRDRVWVYRSVSKCLVADGVSVPAPGHALQYRAAGPTASVTGLELHLNFLMPETAVGGTAKEPAPGGLKVQLARFVGVERFQLWVAVQPDRVTVYESWVGGDALIDAQDQRRELATASFPHSAGRTIELHVSLLPDRFAVALGNRRIAEKAFAKKGDRVWTGFAVQIEHAHVRFQRIASRTLAALPAAGTEPGTGPMVKKAVRPPVIKDAQKEAPKRSG